VAIYINKCILVRHNNINIELMALAYKTVVSSFSTADTERH